MIPAEAVWCGEISDYTNNVIVSCMLALKIARYVSAIATLLITLAAYAASIWIGVALHHVGGILCLAAIGLLGTFIVISYDWPTTWKPLFVKPDVAKL